MKTKIKELRARHDLTQADLAALVNVRRETILFLEKGRYNPSLKLAFKIARALHAQVEEIFLFDEEDLRLQEIPRPKDAAIT